MSGGGEGPHTMAGVCGLYFSGTERRLQGNGEGKTVPVEFLFNTPGSTGELPDCNPGLEMGVPYCLFDYQGSSGLIRTIRRYQKSG